MYITAIGDTKDCQHLCWNVWIHLIVPTVDCSDISLVLPLYFSFYIKSGVLLKYVMPQADCFFYLLLLIVQLLIW